MGFTLDLVLSTWLLQVLFAHSPFPTSDLVRSLSNRDALLEGFLSNDVVGFHAFASARHFMEVGACLWGLYYLHRDRACASLDVPAPRAARVH